MTEQFYIIRLQSPNHYTFGMTSKKNPNDRLKAYTGLNKPSEYVLAFSVDNGRDEEKVFKEFLKIMNIKIFDGNEYFIYDHDIKILVKIYNMFKIIKKIDIYEICINPSKIMERIGDNEEAFMMCLMVCKFFYNKLIKV